jgi:hypothetical protein
MPSITIGWVFTLGVLVHNLEEALYLPAWSADAGRWYRPIGAREFRFAIGVFSAAILVLTAAASIFPARSLGAYLMAGYVLAMVLNVFAPHLFATVLMRRYMPGTATAVLLNLPLGWLYLRQILMEHRIELRVFFWAGPSAVLAILALILVLLALGRRVTSTSA